VISLGEMHAIHKSVYAWSTSPSHNTDVWTHENERLAPPFLWREQTVLRPVQRPMRPVERSSDFSLRRFANVSPRSSPISTIELIQYTKRPERRCIIRCTKHRGGHRSSAVRAIVINDREWKLLRDSALIIRVAKAVPGF